MLGLWFVIRNCISVQITKCIFQKPFSARTPRKPCLCHGSPCSVAGCVTFAKSSLLEIILFCCYKKPASSMAWATFRRFFFSLSFTCQWQYTHKTQDSMFKCGILSQLETRCCVYFPHCYICFYLPVIFQPTVATGWLFYSQLSLSKWRVISTLETQAIYRKNHHTSICSFPSYNFKKFGKCSTVSD